MARTQSSKILIIILIIAVILGISAIGLAWFYSRGNSDNTDTDPGSTLINKCRQINLYNLADDTLIEPGAELNPNDAIRIEAEFENNTSDTAVFETYRFTINESDNELDIDGADVTPSKSGSSNIYKPSVEFDSFEDVTSISITAEAIDTDSLSENSPTCTVIYDVDQDIEFEQPDQPANPDTDGEPTDPSPTDEGKDNTCIAAGAKGSSIDNDSCCAGLMQISCEAPDENNTSQCTGNSECFTCVESNSDDICGAGENSCNSPNDCGTDSPTTGKAAPDAVLQVSNTGPQCVTRIAPESNAELTTTITNTSNEPIPFSKIASSIPLGFTYAEGSALLNGESDNDLSLTIETVGSSQQLTWENTNLWNIPANGSFTLKFNVTAGSQALTGDNVFSTVVTPADPVDNPDALRSDYTFKVAQSCSTPETAIFDSTRARVYTGLLLILASLLFYSNVSLNQVRSLLANTAVAKAYKQGKEDRENHREKFEKDFKK